KNQLPTVPQLQLLVDVVDVIADGLGCDGMLPTDFLAAPAGRHAHQDVALPRAEPRTGRAGPGSPDRLGQRWIQIGAALPHAVNGQCEAFSRRAAGEIPLGLRLAAWINCAGSPSGSSRRRVRPDQRAGSRAPGQAGHRLSTTSTAGLNVARASCTGPVPRARWITA